MPILIVEPGLMTAQPNLSVPHASGGPPAGLVGSCGAAVGVAAGWQATRIILKRTSMDMNVKVRLDISSSPLRLDELNNITYLKNNSYCFILDM
jgi:hypothetical protein